MPAKHLMAFLGVLMLSHLSMLGYASIRCFHISKMIDKPGVVCSRLDGSFQQAVEAYIAVVLALAASNKVQ